MSRRTVSPWLDFKKNGGLPLVFLLMIFLPLADMALRISSPVAVNEKRKLAAKPRLDLLHPWGMARGYEAYFNDHFGFRTRLLRCYNRLTVAWFRISPNEKVLLGRQGWLFMAKESEKRNELAYFRSLKPFTALELEHWVRMLRQRRQWLEKRRISYIFVVVPNKSTVYPEYMPANIRRLHKQSRLDQLRTALQRESGFPIIDLREALRAAKRSHRVYHKTDSHWNDLGAYAAYEKIMEKLAGDFPGLQAVPFREFTVGYHDRIGGDLAMMLALHKNHFREQAIRLKPTAAGPPATTIPMGKLGPFIRGNVVTSPGGTLPTAVMVHDSFIHQLQPLLSPHFKRIVYIWDWNLNFFPEIIDRENPRILIEEMAERELQRLELRNPPLLAGPEPGKKGAALLPLP